MTASAAMLPLAARIDALAEKRPGAFAFLGDAGALSWSDYALRSERFAQHLARLVLAPG